MLNGLDLYFLIIKCLFMCKMGQTVSHYLKKGVEKVLNGNVITYNDWSSKGNA